MFLSRKKICYLYKVLTVFHEFSTDCFNLSFFRMHLIIPPIKNSFNLLSCYSLLYIETKLCIEEQL